MNNEKALNNVKAAIGLLEQIRKEMEKHPPTFKRGDISLPEGDSLKRLFIHNGYGHGRWVGYPENAWTPDSREPKTYVRFCTRAEWASHFPFDPYPLAPIKWRAKYGGQETVIHKEPDGWRGVHIHADGLSIADGWLRSLHQVKGQAAAYMGVPDDVELTWEIVE